MTPLLPIALSLAIVTPDATVPTEPDWSRITHGNWSVWVEDEDGTTRWDPAGSYNAWIDTIDAIDDDLITFDPVQLDLGIPLGYRLSDRPDWSGPVIYRFGDDGDDDGGEHADHSVMIPNTDADSTPPPEGDWVFFPYRGSTTSIIFED